MSILNKNATKKHTIKPLEWYKQSGLFDKGQLNWIEYGFKNGLTEDQVAFYAKPFISADLMYYIEYRLHNGADPEQIFAKETIDFMENRMQEIVSNLQNH